MEKNVEQHANGFYKMPRDADETNSLRLLYDRWTVFYSKNGRPAMCLMKIDENKAGKNWHTE